MKVLVAITGGIAAYKSATLIRCLRKESVEVKVVMTRAAKDFITPLTLATLSGNPIVVENFDPENGNWNSHISLGEWADAMIIAPATANTIAKMAHGVADNLLLCTYLSARCPVWIAPAMDLDMYAHPATTDNLSILQQRGVHIINPTEGFLASGLTGKGRMAEPEQIARILLVALRAKDKPDLNGKNILVTAGGTVENIDPVRFISNYSSGKMGIALANELADCGANVTLVRAHTTVMPDNLNVKIVDAMSAQNMYEAVKERFHRCDIAIFSAAVADYTPVAPKDAKIKHDGTSMTLELKPTPDIAAEMGRIKHKQITIGFALETNDPMENAHRKLHAKNLDAIILNSLADQGAGFGFDTNKITIISPNNTHEYPLKTKPEVAIDIARYIYETYIK